MKIYILVAFIFLLTSCNNIEKEYYDSGELKSIIRLVDKTSMIYYCEEFYKDGNLKARGNLNKDGYYIGNWKEYFCDGELKWDGLFSNGQIVISDSSKWPDFVKRPARIDIEGNSNVLKLGKTYKVRGIVEGVHPSLFHLTDDQYNKLKGNTIDPDCYQYVFTPTHLGEIQIWIIFPDENGVFKVGDRRFAFIYNVIN